MTNRSRRHPGFKDLTGQTFGNLTVVREAQRKAGAAQWLCVCPNGVEVVRPGIHLRRNSKVTRCQARGCKCAQATKAATPKGFVPAPPSAAAPEPVPTIDTERNRERYVRLKLERRSFSGRELMPFAELTCATCHEAPLCKSAFVDFNVGGECLEKK